MLSFTKWLRRGKPVAKIQVQHVVGRDELVTVVADTMVHATLSEDRLTPASLDYDRRAIETMARAFVWLRGDCGFEQGWGSDDLTVAALNEIGTRAEAIVDAAFPELAR